MSLFRPSPLTAGVGREKSSLCCFAGGHPRALDPAVEVEASLSAPLFSVNPSALLHAYIQAANFILKRSLSIP